MFSKKYEVLCKLGWGQYSTVWLVRDQFSRSLYAMKVHRSSPAYMEAAEYECRIFVCICDHGNKQPCVPCRETRDCISLLELARVCL